jgi:hypothetical protein
VARDLDREGDPLRLLHVRSELGYTDHIHHGLRDEPEAVSAEEQRRQTQIARRNERERLRVAWQVVVVALDDFLATRLPPAVGRQASRLARDAKAVDRELRAI